MKRNRVPSPVLVLAALVLTLGLAGCMGTQETTTTAGGTGTTAGGTGTTLAGQDSAAIADAAIAAVTKSARIQTPSTLKAGALQAGSDTAFPPMEFLVKKGTYTGFDVDLCTALAKKLGLTLEIIPTDWVEIVPALLDKRFDMVMSAMIITPELQAEVAFTASYLPAVLTISAPIDAPINDAAGLAGKTVGVQLDTIGASQVAAIAGVTEVKAYNTLVDAFRDLAAGHIQALVAEEIISTYILENNADLKTALANTGKIVIDNGYGYAIRKEDTALLTALDAALLELRTEGVYEKICAKWGVTGN